MIAAQDLVGKILVSAADGKVLGTIKECVCLLDTGSILGLVIDASSRLLGEKAVAGADIAVVGTDAVLVEDEKKLMDTKDVPRLEDHMRPAEAEPLAVFTTKGKRLGTVGRIMIAPDEKRVVSYEVTGGALRDLADGTHFMPIMEGVIHGEDSILVPPEAASKLQPAAAGLSTVWDKVTEGVARLKGRGHKEDQPKATSDATPATAAPKPAKKPLKRKPAKKAAKKTAKKTVKKTAKKAAKKPAKKASRAKS